MPSEIIVAPDGKRWRLVWFTEKTGGETAILTELDDEQSAEIARLTEEFDEGKGS